MEENNKNSVIVLAVSIIIVLLCIGAYIFLKKDKPVSVNIQAISKDTKEVDGLNTLLSKAKFVNDQKEEMIKEDFSDKINISVKIENQTIVIRTLNRNVNITSIKDPISVSTFYVGGVDGLPVDVYVLNKEGKLYHINFLADDPEYKDVEVIQFAVSDVESYSTNVRDIEEQEEWSNFVVAKTKEGKYYTNYMFKGDDEYTFREIINTGKDIDDDEEEDEEEKIYGILSTVDVNPYSSLDFNKRIIPEGETYNIDFDSTSIKYTDRDSNTTAIEISNVKQVGLYCDEAAGPCDKIIYLTNDGNLYVLNASEDGKFDTNVSKAKLISNNVKAFSLIPVIIYDIATGGEQSVVYKKSDGKTYLYDFYKSNDISQYKKIWVDQTYENPLYIVSKDVKVDVYLKTNEGKNIAAKKVFVFDGLEEDGNGESFMFVYVLNEDNYLYYTENYKRGMMELFNELKVRNVEVRDDDFVVTYANGKKETIDAYIIYEAK
ncbi:MAG: hypothetical protein IJK67_01510 [Bacilli bacterium]|nr:hypothetical protein [Bacilli bacterium]